MSEPIQIHQFENGLTLVAESMPWLESAAFALLLPAGCSRDPDDLPGLSNFACEMVQRGCGPRNSRRFVEDLELLGVEDSTSVSVAHSLVNGAMPAESLLPALEIYADVAQRPHLPAEQLEDARQVCLLEVLAVEDNLAQKAMQELTRRHYPDPWGRSCQGTEEAVNRVSIEAVRGHVASFSAPNPAILSVAGRFDWDALRDHVGELFGAWSPRELPPIVEKPAEGKYQHIPHDSSQTHIGVAFPSVPYADKDFFKARGAVGVLSDGTSSRLFTEVRENRGLCYAVQASLDSLRDRGSVFCYAGTTTDRAQETLDVLIGELQRLAQGIHEEELQLLKTRVKSALIMQQESSRARSFAIAADWYHLRTVRSRDEVGAIIDGLTCDSINRYLAEHAPREFTVVTLGDKPLEMPFGIS